MRLEGSIGWRYLLSPRSEGAISFITLVAILGVMLGVCALVVAMAVMNGYQANLIRAMAGSMPHVSIHPTRGGSFSDVETFERTLRKKFKPVAVAPFALHEILVQARGGAAASIHGVMLRGVDPQKEMEVPTFLNLIDDGSPEWAALSSAAREVRGRKLLLEMARPNAGGVIPILLSRNLAHKLGVGLNERLTPMTFPKPDAGFSPLPVERQLVVRGYFKTGIPVFDELVVLIPLLSMHGVMPGKTVEYSLGMRLSEPLQAAATADVLRAAKQEFPEDYYVYSWLESNGALFQVIRFQKNILFLVLMLIVVIAFFGMVSALTMLVAEKGREIAILKALGLRGRSITGLFLVQGFLIGLIGTALGTGLGLAVCALLDYFPLITIPPGVYPGTDRIPVLVSPADVALVIVSTMAVCFVAILYPARKAGGMTPVEGLRPG